MTTDSMSPGQGINNRTKKRGSLNLRNRMSTESHIFMEGYKLPQKMEKDFSKRITLSVYYHLTVQHSVTCDECLH